MKKYLHKRSIDELARLICGPTEKDRFAAGFKYRTAAQIERFFKYCDLDLAPTSGDSRPEWVKRHLIWFEDPPETVLPNRIMVRILRELLDRQDYGSYEDYEGDVIDERESALGKLKQTLARDNIEPFFDQFGTLQLRNNGSSETTLIYVESDRPWSEAEHKAKGQWDAFLKKCSEDDFIEKLLLPLFRQMHFKRVKVAGHKDKALEFGKDMWMKYQMPMGTYLYFGLQAKKDKIDAAASGKNENVSTVIRQIHMVLDHPIFDDEVNKKVLVDHVIIATAGEITKAAQSLIIEKLDASQRRSMIFLQREQLTSLAVDYRVPLPEAIVEDPDAIPF